MNSDDMENLQFLLEVMLAQEEDVFEQWYDYNMDIYPEYTQWMVGLVSEVADILAIDHKVAKDKKLAEANKVLEKFMVQ